MYEFVLSAFGDEIAPDIETQLQVLERFGIKNIELRNINSVNISSWEPKKFREIADFIKDRGFGVSSLGSPIGKIKITDDFAPHLDKFKNTVELATIAQTKYIRMFSFYVEKDRFSECRDEVLKRWNMFVEAAKGSGVTLLHENEHGIYGQSPENCAEIIKMLNTDNVKAVFDPANFAIDGYDTVKAFELLKDDSVYFHIKDAVASCRRVVPAGEGEGNVKYIIEQLMLRGYKGFLSLEPHLATGDIAVGGEERFATAYRALKKVIAEAEDVQLKK